MKSSSYYIASMSTFTGYNFLNITGNIRNKEPNVLIYFYLVHFSDMHTCDLFLFTANYIYHKVDRLCIIVHTRFFEKKIHTYTIYLVFKTRQSVACNARRHPVLGHQNTYAKSQPWNKHCLDIGHQCYLAVLRDK